MRSALLLGLTACSFSPAHATSDGMGSGSSLSIDASVPPDGNDAQEANGRRKALTFMKPGATLADFPAWIDLTDTQIAARAAPDGRDIYFTAADGSTRLDHELMSWDGARLRAWVRIPSLDSATATQIFVNYGDPGAAPAANPAGVFKRNYVAVWHLDDTLPAQTIVDATNTHPGTPTLTTATTSATGQLGKGLAFTDSTDMIVFDTPLTGTTPHTISAWVDQKAALTHTAAIVAMGSAGGGQSRWLHGHYDNNSFAVGYYGPDIDPNPAQVIDGAGWTRLDWTYEGSNSKNHLYRNGVEITGSPITTTGTIDTPAGTKGYIGFAPEPSYGANNGYEGTIDDVRISNVARVKEWIAAEYANQNNPSSTYTVGAEQNEP